jgi:hypothetical protein
MILYALKIYMEEWLSSGSCWLVGSSDTLDTLLTEHN